ncbi:hypothetical protein BT93_F0187 [Corymbia citriodora subsp. variegata]|nr:hypothetical protein BT93_F0187 [Corymbia citriodora subsp. variegata]
MFRGFPEMEGQRDDSCEFLEKDVKRGGGEAEEEEDYDEDIRGGEGEDQCENRDALKRSISNHPLYGKLVQAHLNCLKVGGACKDDMTLQTTMNPQVLLRQHQHGEAKISMSSQSDLDQFMETYCSVLSKLREAMEEPQLETMAFIDDMHSQLKNMITTPPPTLPSTSSLSGETNA